MSVEVASFPDISVDVIDTVNSPSSSDDKFILSIEYEPSSFSVISSIFTVTVFVPSVIVKEFIVEPASTFPDISEVVISLAFITSSPLSSVISILFEVAVSSMLNVAFALVLLTPSNTS